VIKKCLAILFNWKELIGLLIFWQAILSAPFSVDLSVTYSSNPVFIPLVSEQSSEDASMFQIVVTNESSDSISNIEVTLNGINKVYLTGYRTSSKRLMESYGNAIDYEFRDETSLYLSELEEIPSGHNVQIQLLVEEAKFLLGSRINVTADSENIEVSGVSKVSGFWGFLASYSNFIVVCLAMGAIILGLTRMKGEE